MMFPRFQNRIANFCALVAATLVLPALAFAGTQAGNIPISALPFNITSPGNYFLTGNLTAPPTVSSINISTAIAGPVVLDLNGFTISGSIFGPGTMISIGAISPGVANAFPITIKNGTLYFFTETGIATNELPNGAFYSNITVKNVVLDASFLTVAIQFNEVNSSTVSDCTLIDEEEGIVDEGSSEGNSYKNVAFLDGTMRVPFRVSSQNSSVVLKRCKFDEPAAVQSATITNLTALKANIPISYLPFNITAPGTYVLTHNLTAPENNSGNFNTEGISISSAVTGPVVVDLKGFTLTGTGTTDQSIGVSIGFNSPGIVNTCPVTIKNGTIQNFAYGVWASIGNAAFPAALADITVTNIVFNDLAQSVLLERVDSSTVSNCTFNGDSGGIQDEGSNGGNTFANDSFTKIVEPLVVFNEGAHLSMDRCQFDKPAPVKP
jgi:hypothetical protein